MASVSVSLLKKSLPRQTAVAKRGFSALLSVDMEYPIPALNPQPAKATEASVTTLPSGLTVVTEGSCPTSTVSVTYPKAGSGSEAIDAVGAAHVSKCLGFKSGSDMSTLYILRSIETAGAVPFTKADRFGATLGYTGPRETATSIVNMLTVECSMEPWDVRDAKAHAKVEADEAATSAQIMLTESLYAAAYGPQTSAGRPFYMSSPPSTSALADFYATGYGMNGAVLAATGVDDHAAFCAEVSELTKSAAAGTPDKPAAFAYMGGESRIAAPSSGYAHVALAFEFKASSAVANVVKNALNIAGAEAGLSAFTAPGLVGLYGGSETGAGLVDSMAASLGTKMSADIIKRAKALAKIDALMALDNGSAVLAETMTAAVLESGSFSGPADVAKTYDSITDKAVTSAVADMLKSNPSLAAVGDISMVPYHASL